MGMLEHLADWAGSFFDPEDQGNGLTRHHQDKLHQDLLHAIKTGSRELKAYLLAHQHDIDFDHSSAVYSHKNPHHAVSHQTPLAGAVSTGNIAAVEVLLNPEVVPKADPNSVNNTHHRDTPLHIATRNKHLDMVALLLGKGANPGIKNAKGYHMLDILIRLISSGHGKSDEDMRAHAKQVPDLEAEFKFVYSVMTMLMKHSKSSIHNYVDNPSHLNKGIYLYCYIDMCMLITLEWANMPKVAWSYLDGITQCLVQMGVRLAEQDAQGNTTWSATNDRGDNLLHRLMHWHTLQPNKQSPIVFQWLAKLVKLGVPTNGLNNDRLMPVQIAPIAEQGLFYQAFKDVRKLSPAEFAKQYNLPFPLESSVESTLGNYLSSTAGRLRSRVL